MRITGPLFSPAGDKEPGPEAQVKPECAIQLMENISEGLWGAEAPLMNWGSCW